jgi:protein involved in polysaccharide export with SLBB domain
MARFAFLIVFFLSAISAAFVPALSQPPAAAAAEHSQSDYKLGIADKVRMIVYNEPNLSGEFSVGSNGQLSLPMIGNVPALNRSVETVRADVEARFADGYLVKPNVSMEILSFRPFYILGEVAKPGEYPFSVDLTVMKAVAMAQGYTYRAEKKHVFIRKQGETEERRVKLSVDALVQPGDTIRVAERFF